MPASSAHAGNTDTLSPSSYVLTIPILNSVVRALGAHGVKPASLRCAERSRPWTVAPRMCPVGSIVVTCPSVRRSNYTALGERGRISCLT